ncbi:MAG: spore coat protein U domain-containing protein [Sphingomonadales bacterium]|nr:spore coat protein U domain-containing protein [Sphingomonadales bacterium]
MSIRKRMVLPTLASAAACGMLLSSAPVAAAGFAPPANVDVILIIENSCTLAGDGLLDFGTTGAGVTANDINAQSTGITLTCSGPVPNAEININGGNNLNGSQRQLKLETGKGFVPYELYRDPGRRFRYDPAPPVPCTKLCIPGGVPLPSGASELIVYGQIPVGTPLDFGRFSDAAQITVDF